ncbi:MAG: ion transporter [Pseudomonadota bacterium]|nr:ion transporter [Pseudomonadota bacterium]
MRTTKPNIFLSAREWVYRLVESSGFQKAIMALIVVNAITLGMETSTTVMSVIGPELQLFDQFVIIVFCIELTLRIYAHGLKFFCNSWNIFDFFVVAITLTPSNDSLSVMRALRILRVLRLISAVPRLRRIVTALLNAIPGVGAISALLLLVFYVFSVITTKLFAAAFPEWFGTIGASMFSLFQIMTLESWSMGIVRPVMETYSWAWAVFVAFIILSSFTVLNLFIAIIIDSMQTLHETEKNQEVEDTVKVAEDENQKRVSEFEELRREIRELKSILNRRGRDG